MKNNFNKNHIKNEFSYTYSYSVYLFSLFFLNMNYTKSFALGDQVTHPPLLEDAKDANGHSLPEEFFSSLSQLTCFVLTASSNDVKRCDYIKKLLVEDVGNFDDVIVVMAERDWANTEYCRAIGVQGEDKLQKVHVIRVPNGPKTAGYTRSWCFYLATFLTNDDATVVVRDDRRFIRPGKRVERRLLRILNNPCAGSLPSLRQQSGNTENCTILLHNKDRAVS